MARPPVIPVDQRSSEKATAREACNAHHQQPIVSARSGQVTVLRGAREGRRGAAGRTVTITRSGGDTTRMVAPAPEC